MAVIQFEIPGFNHSYGNIFAVDANCLCAGANHIQDNVYNFLKSVTVIVIIPDQVVEADVLFNQFLIFASLIRPIHPIKIDRWIVHRVRI